jgi:DNA modification methylase
LQSDFKAELEWRDPKELIPYANNAKTHPSEQVSKIAASIAGFGFDQPIVVDQQGIIIKGHGRLQASLKLGLTRVPVVVRTDLTPAEAKAARIADNKTAESPWDEELLRLELAMLEEARFDLNLTGFSDEEIGELLRDPDEPAAGKTDEDSTPEAQVELVSRPGDVWILGKHRLLCGDSTQIEAVEKVLAGGLADMVFCDPPYNVNYGGKNRKIANDNLGSEFERFLYDACVNMLTVCKGSLYIAMSSSELHTLEKAFREAGGHWSTFVIWAKSSFSMGRSDYQRQYEPILYGWKEGTSHLWCGARDQGDVWFIKKPHLNDLHPTMKPVELVERAVQNSSKTRDTVLDPFGGSGTTLIACERTGRPSPGAGSAAWSSRGLHPNARAPLRPHRASLGERWRRAFARRRSRSVACHPTAALAGNNCCSPRGNAAPYLLAMSPPPAEDFSSKTAFVWNSVACIDRNRRPVLDLEVQKQYSGRFILTLSTRGSNIDTGRKIKRVVHRARGAKAAGRSPDA